MMKRSASQGEEGIVKDGLGVCFITRSTRQLPSSSSLTHSLFTLTPTFLLSEDTNSLPFWCLKSSGQHSFAHPFPDAGSGITPCSFPVPLMPSIPSTTGPRSRRQPEFCSSCHCQWMLIYFSKLPYSNSFAMW